MPKTRQQAIIDTVKALITAAGLAQNVAAADIRQAANTLSQEYGKAYHREIEAEIARRIRNGG